MMLKERACIASSQAAARGTRNARVKMYETPAGPLFLQRGCSAAFVETLEADAGLNAFARQPAREHALLLSLARQPETC